LLNTHASAIAIPIRRVLGCFLHALCTVKIFIQTQIIPRLWALAEVGFGSVLFTQSPFAVIA